MSKRRSRAFVPLLQDTALASSEVIGLRMSAFADPGQWASARNQREASRMVLEKWSAGAEGAAAAWLAMARMPLLVAQSGLWLSPWQPQGWWRLWASTTQALMGLGDAALRPATRKAVANRRRLRAR